MIKAKVFSLEDFSGGLNTCNYTKGLEPKFSPNCANVHSNIYKKLIARNGFAVFSNTLGAGQKNSYGIYKYVYLTGGTTTDMLIKFSDSKMWKMDALDGTWDEITLTTAQTASFHSATVYSTASANYFIFSNNALETMQIWSGTGATSNIDTTTISSARYLISWKNHLWCLYTKESGVVCPYRLRRTNINTYGSAAADWTGGVSGYDDVITSDGDYATALVGLKTNIYIFKKNSIFRVTYMGGVPLVEIKQMAGIGTDAPNTIKKITLQNGEEYLIFLGTDNRVYMFDGYNAPQSVSELAMDDNGLSSYSLGKINKIKRSFANAENYVTKHWYVLFVPLTGSDVVNVGYIIDYYATPFSIFPITGVDAMSCVVADDSAGARNLYMDKSDGITYKFDSGNADVAAAINAFYETPKLKADKLPHLKKVQQMQSFWKQTGNYNTTLSYRTNNTTTYVDNTINMNTGDGESISAINDIPQVMNNIQLKITNNTTDPRPVLYEIDLIGEAEGIATA